MTSDCFGRFENFWEWLQKIYFRACLTKGIKQPVVGTNSLTSCYYYTPFFINNQKFKQLPRISQICQAIFKQFPEANKRLKLNNLRREQIFFCIGNLREMLTFGLVSSKVCITYSRCPCNKLWRRLECLNN